MKSLALWTILLLLLTSCSAPNEIKQKNYKRTHEKKYLPILNTKPKYFVTISGNIDPKLSSSSTTPYFAVMYYTKNMACYTTTDWAEGIEDAQHRIVRYRVNLKHNKFKFIIPIDKYNSGFCQWGIRQITFNNGFYPTSSHIAYFTPCGKDPLCTGQNQPDKQIKLSTASHVECSQVQQSKQLICRKAGKFHSLGDAIFVPRNKNYEYKLDFKFKQDR